MIFPLDMQFYFSDLVAFCEKGLWEDEKRRNILHVTAILC
jgi:hypothetical protein